MTNTRFTRFLFVFKKTSSSLLLAFAGIYALDFIFRINSYMLFMTVHEILLDSVLMVFFGMCLIVIISIVLGLAAGLLPGKFRLDVGIVRFVYICSASIAATLFLQLFKTWIETILGVHIHLGRIKALIPLIIFMLLFYFDKNRQKALSIITPPSRLGIFHRSALVIWIACLLLILLSPVFLHEYESVMENKFARPKLSKLNDKPNIFIISIDTLTAENMSLYGYERETTPNITAFSHRAKVFTHAYSVSNFTTPGVVSIMTGQYPTIHGAMHLFGYLSPDAASRTMPRLLREKGYKTAAFVSNPWAHPLHTRMRDSFDYVPAPPRADSSSLSAPFGLLSLYNSNLHSSLNQWLEPLQRILTLLPWEQHLDSQTGVPPRLVFNKALESLEKLGSGPKFIWTHVSPPHDPYLPESPFLFSFRPERDLITASEQSKYRGNYGPEMQEKINALRDRYDEHIAYTDHSVGIYLKRLEELGYLNNSIIVITADHGESFADGYQGHGGPMLTQNLIHIPLIVYLPPSMDKDLTRRHDFNVSQIDVAPTLLSKIGLTVPSWMNGEDILSSSTQEKVASRTLFSSNLETCSKFNPTMTCGTMAVIRGTYKLFKPESGKDYKFYEISGKEKFLYGNSSEFEVTKTGLINQISLHYKSVPLH